MAKVVFISSEFLELTDGNREVHIQGDNLEEILSRLINRYSKLTDRFYTEEKVLRSTVLIFHNKNFVREKNIFDYRVKIGSDDELIIATPFSGG